MEAAGLWSRQPLLVGALCIRLRAPSVRSHAVARAPDFLVRRDLMHPLRVISWSFSRRRCFIIKTGKNNIMCQSSFRHLPIVKSITCGCMSLMNNLCCHLEVGSKILKRVCHLRRSRRNIYVVFVRIIVAMSLMMTVSLASSATHSMALTEQNLLFLEAWRAVDRAYYDKSFNGQSWFRYRESALRNEPMSTREETYAAIKKMLSTLNDPFTRFLEPEKFKSLRSGSQGALTGVGLSMGYPVALNGSPSGLVVISSTPGGPAEKAGILPGDMILMIDNVITDGMDIYDAADRLQGPDGSSVDLAIRNGSETRHVILKREKITLNPVKSRLCEISRSDINSKIGYIKLTSFNQNASGAIKEAIKTLKENNVKAFVLDLRNNSGGLFPEGIETAKIWLEKGVIVYICDTRGVRDVYEADGANTIVAKEPLVVLVNRGTASASEILAGALKDNRRAVIYGERTYGKGKIQSVFELSDGSALVITVARYETPAHTDIDKVGIIPDHPLPASFPEDEDGFCSCLRDADSTCNLSAAQLFATI